MSSMCGWLDAWPAAERPRLTPEERAEIMRVQDRLIELLVDRGDAVAAGNSARAELLLDEIDDPLRERDDVRMSAAAPAKVS